MVEDPVPFAPSMRRGQGRQSVGSLPIGDAWRLGSLAPNGGGDWSRLSWGQNPKCGSVGAENEDPCPGRDSGAKLSGAITSLSEAQVLSCGLVLAKVCRERRTSFSLCETCRGLWCICRPSGWHAHCATTATGHCSRSRWPWRKHAPHRRQRHQGGEWDLASSTRNMARRFPPVGAVMCMPRPRSSWKRVEVSGGLCSSQSDCQGFVWAWGSAGADDLIRANRPCQILPYFRILLTSHGDWVGGTCRRTWMPVIRITNTNGNLHVVALAMLPLRCAY